MKDSLLLFNFSTTFVVVNIQSGVFSGHNMGGSNSDKNAVSATPGCWLTPGIVLSEGHEHCVGITVNQTYTPTLAPSQFAPKTHDGPSWLGKCFIHWHWLSTLWSTPDSQR
jgi:hypothetical protein